MDLQAVSRYLVLPHTADLATRVLLNYNQPLTQKEAKELGELQARQREQLEAGLAVEETPDDMKQCLEQPLTALHPLMVVRCVVAAAKVPVLPFAVQRQLQRVVLTKVTCQTPLTLPEWYAVLHVAHAQLASQARSNPTALNCLTQLLLCSAAVIFQNTQAVVKRQQWRAQPRKAEEELKLKETTVKEAQALWFKCLTAVVLARGEAHASKRQHSLTSETRKKGNEVFLWSCPVVRLSQLIKDVVVNNADTAAVEAVKETLASLDPLELLVLHVVAAPAWAAPLSKDVVIQLLKTKPEPVSQLLGTPVAGALTVDKQDDLIQTVLYNANLTTATKEGYMASLRVLASLPKGALLTYVATKGKDALLSFFTPYVNNPKVITLEVAKEARTLLVEHLLKQHLLLGFEKTDDRDKVWQSFAEVLPTLLTTRCRSAVEKAVVLHLGVEAMQALRSPFIAAEQEEEASTLLSLVAAVPEMTAVLGKEIVSPSADCAAPALRLCGVLQLLPKVRSALSEVIKTAKKEEEYRRVVLVNTDPFDCSDDLVTDLVCPLLEKCEVVEVSRPDAFLSLIFVIGYQKRNGTEAVSATNFGKWARLLSTAGVLGRLDFTNPNERTRAAEVAIELLKEGHCGAFNQLLLHPSGLLGLQLVHYLRSPAGATEHHLQALWRSARSDVFGLDQEIAPARLSDCAERLGREVLRAVIPYTKPTELPDLLLCCAHDAMQGGADPVLYQHHASTLRRREDFRRLNTRIFDSIFTEGKDVLLSEHVAALTDRLTEALLMPEHVAHAAVGAFTLLLTKTTVAASLQVFERLRKLMEGSIDYFVSLDERDRAIAVGTPDELAKYEDNHLRAEKILKTYPDRPPKGVSADEFEYTKRKDAVALAKAREELKEEMKKRADKIKADIHKHKHSFLTVQSMGLNGKFHIQAVAVLYPLLQATLNRSYDGELPKIVESLALDTIGCLTYHTPLRHLSEVLATTVGRLHGVKTMTVPDVSQVSTLAQALRVALSRMIPAPLFVMLTPFAAVAFKAGRGGNAVATTIQVSTQHQLMGVLLQNLGQPDLPAPTETLQLLSNILTSFPALYKSVQQGFNALMSMIPASQLIAIEVGLFSTIDSVREVTATSLHRFSHFSSCRRALVLAAIFSKDESSPNIPGHMQSIIDNPEFHWELLPSDWEEVLDFLRRYGQRRQNAIVIMQTVKQLFSREDATEEQQAAWTTGIQSVGGLASVVALQELSPTLRPKVPVQVMNYLCDVLESPEASETLLRAVLQAGRVILRDAPLETINLLAADMQARLSKPPKDATAPQKEQHLATATVWLTMISCRLQQVDLLEAIVEQQSRILNNSQSAMVHRCVCDAMSEITKNETIRKSPKIDDFMEKCLKQVFHSGSYVKKKAHGAGVAGVLNGLGLSGLRRYHLLEEIEKAAKEKQNEKSGAMVLIEALCDTMGNRFEPYALHLSNILLEGVADPDLRISECADDASRVFMSSLTGVGLRQLIPKLIEALSTDVAKKRVPPLNFVGYVAFCSPKQLAATLPQIMKHINSCLFDVNTAVSQAAYHALKRVAGVVSNPEIQEHVDLILNAMRSPSTEIEPALDALLYTRYVNVVDAASLALIIPVLSRGLGGQMAHRTRPRSAQIIASMISLVGDPKALAPYAEELIQLLQESCQDPQPESRTTAAKALGALSAALGGDLVENIVQWSFSVMQRITNSSTIEKAGAAQALVEVINCCGDSVFESHFDTIEGGMTSEKPPVREGFLYIMVYAPPILRTESFQRILPIAFPWVLDGLSHYSDKVRDVALAAGESIISLYGTRQLSLVLEPLLVSVVSEVTTLRHSSLILTSKLLLHVVSNIKKKMRVQQALETVAEDDREEVAATIEATEAGNDEGLGIVLESARDVERQGYSLLGQLEVTLGTTNLNRVLSAIYCGRHEHSVNVRTDTNNAWQAAVASIRTAVSKIFGTLVPLLVRFASSENPDCVEVAEKSIEFTCRLGETVDSFVGDLCEVYKQDDRRSHLGALNCIACVASQMDSKRLIAVSGEILGVMMPAMQDQDQEVQESARKVFAMLTKAAGSVDVVEKAVITQLESGATNGVVEVVKVKPATALEIIMNRLTASKTHTYQHVELISAIISVPEAEEELHKYVKETVQLILLFISQKLEGVTKLAEKYFGLVGVGYRGVVVDTIQKALRVKQTRRAGLIAAVAVSCSVEVDDLSSITLGFATIIDCLADAEPETSAEAVRALPVLLLNLETRIVDSLSEEDKQDATSGKRAAGRYLLQFLKLFHDNLPSVARSVLHGEEKFTILEEGEPKLIDVLIGLYNRGLDYGTPDQKVMAVECIQELLSLAPPDLCAAVSNTVAGRCSKVLFIRNEGRVVLALVRLCAQVLEFSFSTGKEKMVMSSMAQATFNAALCDSGEARALTLRIVITLLQKSDKQADLILGTVLTKKAAVDSILFQTVLCRFISVVMRYGHYTKAFPHITKLMDMIMPWWEESDPRTPALSAASGVAVGALCTSASVTEEQLSDIKERTLAASSTKGASALAGFAATYSLLTSAPERVDDTFITVAAEHLKSAAKFAAPDKLTTLWMLRAAAAIARTRKLTAAQFSPEVYEPLVRRTNAQDEQSLSTSQFFYEVMEDVYPQAAANFANYPMSRSFQWESNDGVFDADLDDEMEADTAI